MAFPIKKCFPLRSGPVFPYSLNSRCWSSWRTKTDKFQVDMFKLVRVWFLLPKLHPKMCSQKMCFPWKNRSKIRYQQLAQRPNTKGQGKLQGCHGRNSSAVGWNVQMKIGKLKGGHICSFDMFTLQWSLGQWFLVRFNSLDAQTFRDPRNELPVAAVA